MIMHDPLQLPFVDDETKLINNKKIFCLLEKSYVIRCTRSVSKQCRLNMGMLISESGLSAHFISRALPQVHET